MFTTSRTFIIIILSLIILAGPMSVQAREGNFGLEKEPSDPMAMVLDLVIARPLGLATTFAGVAFFIVSSPLSALGGNTDEAWNTLVVSPAGYTFKRPLGRFEQ